MKIAIDLQSCQTDSRNRGIGRYAMSLTAALSECRNRGDQIEIGIDAVDTDRLRDVRSTLRHRGVIANVAAACYPNTSFSDMSPAISSVAGMMRARLFASFAPDIVLVTSFFEVGSCYSSALQHAALAGIPTAVIAYDIIPLLFPDRYLPEGQFIDGWYRSRLEEFKKFDLFLAISEATRRDLIEHLGVEPERVRMVGAGLDAALVMPSGEDSSDRLSSLGIRDPFVLMVGNADWRKNSMGALEAFAALPADLRKRHQLVFTQVGDDVNAALRGSHAHLRDRVVIAGKVCEATLRQLYSRCRVFFFPSFYEGFGLPILEAMALGAPVLSSDRGSLAEVVHDTRILFDPRDPKATASALRRALEDDGFRDLLLDGARDHALTFTWDRCARQVLDALSDLVLAKPVEPALDWYPSQHEIAAMADAAIETGPSAERQLRNGLQAIAAGGQRRILVDITEVIRLDARSGIQRVVRNYMAGLASVSDVARGEIVEPIYWEDGDIRYARKFARERLGIAIPGEDDFIDIRANDLLFMLDSSWWSSDRFDSLSKRVWEAGGEVVWMVYDLVPIAIPEHCDPVMPPVFREWLEHVVPRCDGFVCISEATRHELERFIDETLPSSRRRPWTRSLHLGSDLESGRVEAPTDAALAISADLAGRPWLVALGTVEPRKDYATVLEAYERLWAEQVDVGLVIIGKQGWNVDALSQRLRAHEECGKRLFWLEGLSDGDVRHLLSGSKALVQASLAEGFGLPVVEAGSLGIPLLLSDIPVFHEIAGDEATYFPVSDPEALAGIIADRIAGGWKKPERIKTMTWLESSAKLADLLRFNTVG